MNGGSFYNTRCNSEAPGVVEVSRRKRTELARKLNRWDLRPVKVYVYTLKSTLHNVHVYVITGVTASNTFGTEKCTIQTNG